VQIAVIVLGAMVAPCVGGGGVGAARRRGPTARHGAVRGAPPQTRYSAACLEQTANLSVSLTVGQVRATAVDLLRGSGLDRDEAERPVGEVARLPA